jgi:YggT family protein
MIDPLVGAILDIVSTVVGIYIFVVFAAVVMSWLMRFNVVNRSNQVVYMIADGLYKLTAPVFNRVRRFVPDIGGLDISPIIVLLALYFIQNYLTRLRF